MPRIWPILVEVPCGLSYPPGSFMELGERGNSRTVPGAPSTPRSGCTVLRGVGGTCPWSGFHLRRPLRPSPMARMCVRLFHKKDHRGWPLNEPEQSTRGLETPAGCPPNGPPLAYPPVIALGAFPGPANAALAIARGFRREKEKGAWGRERRPEMGQPFPLNA